MDEEGPGRSILPRQLLEPCDAFRLSVRQPQVTGPNAHAAHQRPQTAQPAAKTPIQDTAREMFAPRVRSAAGSLYLRWKHHCASSRTRLSASDQN